jgi:hypothetical protein
MSVGSSIMLNNANALNNINPFVTYGPGTSNKPYGFSKGVPDKDQVQCDDYGCALASSKLDTQSYIEKKVSRSPWEPYEASPLCEWGIHAQTNGSLDAPSCLPKKNPVDCLMGRPLEPTQEFVPDLYTLLPYKDPVPKELLNKTRTHSNDFTPVLIVAAVVLLALVFVKR